MSRNKMTILVAALALMLSACGNSGDQALERGARTPTGKADLPGDESCADLGGRCLPLTYPMGQCNPGELPDDSPGLCGGLLGQSTTCCRPCPPNVCTLYCEHGYAVDENGCTVCACKEPERTVATGTCIRNSFDSCDSDEDCVAGGCGGELCYNPAAGGGYSTCDCFEPVGVSCGCVDGSCAWWR